MAKRHLPLFFAALSLAGPGLAQPKVQNFEAEGNLAPTQDVGCIPVTEADPSLSPADLSLSVMACFQKGEDLQAGELMVLMLARGRFDIDRVTDTTAHQAVQVLSLNLATAGGTVWQPRMGKVFGLFQSEGSAELASLCATLRAMPAPQHSPSYMIQHGMGAFLKEDKPALVETFDADATWRMVLDDYLHCPAQ